MDQISEQLAQGFRAQVGQVGATNSQISDAIMDLLQWRLNNGDLWKALTKTQIYKLKKGVQK